MKMDLGPRLKGSRVAVVIPCYRVERHIEDVIRRVPDFVEWIIAVDDQSPDQTGAILDRLAGQNDRLVVIHRPKNGGVGAATLTGYQEALQRPAQIVVKVDGDGQMEAADIPWLIAPILVDLADYAKGNRLLQPRLISRMPVVRRLGNLGLSFLVKAASGYWGVMDPTNGFTAISVRTLQRLDSAALASRYRFESSMLVQLYRTRARLAQITMAPSYGEENSSLNVGKSLVEFPPYLFKSFVVRLVRSYFWEDFTPVFLFLFLGTILMTFGLVFGLYHWIAAALANRDASAGTVIVAALPFILGFQLWLQAFVLDMNNTPECRNLTPEDCEHLLRIDGEAKVIVETDDRD
jgi:dolichol-phosphate mannosyltransferase